MKITIEIKEKDYTFEMNREVYKQLLQDEEYSKVQNELTKKVEATSNENENIKVEDVKKEILNDDTNVILLRNMIMQEQIFYYSLLKNQPNISVNEASELLDSAIDEYGMTYVSNLITKLMENFTQREGKSKKKMVMRMG